MRTRRFFQLLRQCATDISLSLARAGRSVPLFLKNRLKFNDAFFNNGDTRHVLSGNGIRWTSAQLARLESTELIGLPGKRGNRRLPRGAGGTRQLADAASVQ
jgi:hypothetical protein